MRREIRTRVGVVGAGGVGARHITVLRGLGDVDVVAVADTDAQRAAAVAEGAEVFSAVQPMLDGAGLDAVYLCVPPFAHGDPERAVIEAGLPFFVEKPLDVDLAVAEDIAERVRASGTLTATGYHWRYLDTVERAAQLLGENPAVLASGSWWDKVPPVGWWGQRALSGGQVAEQLTHVLDLARVLLGEVEEVTAYGARGSDPGMDIDTATVATLRFASGALATLSATCRLGWKERAGLQVVADGLVLDLSETALAVASADGRAEHTPRVDARVAVDRAFIDAVQGNGNDVRAPYEEALRTHRVAVAITSSVGTGQPVRPASA